jgi:hypothetical protein
MSARPATPFTINLARRIANVTDGTSNTLFAAECKTYALQLRSCSAADSPPLGGLSPTNYPTTVGAAIAYIASNMGSCKQEAVGHDRWKDGGVYYGGFTTALPPNAQVGLPANIPSGVKTNPAGVSYTGGNQDFDWLSVDENNGGPSLGSHHIPELPPRRGERPLRRWQRPVRQGFDRPDHLAVARHDGRWRGRLGRLVLTRGRRIVSAFAIPASWSPLMTTVRLLITATFLLATHQAWAGSPAVATAEPAVRFTVTPYLQMGQAASPDAMMRTRPLRRHEEVNDGADHHEVRSSRRRGR